MALNDQTEIDDENDLEPVAETEQQDTAEEKPVTPSPQERDYYDKHPELVDLAPHIKERLGEDKLCEIGELVCEEFKQDEESRQDWLTMQAEWVKLYYMKDKPTNRPWSGSSEESLPILLEGCQQFHTRSYKQFFGTNQFVSSRPVGNVTKEDNDRADRVGKFMSWQLEVQDRNYQRNKDRLLRALPLHGSVFTKTYRDHIRKMNVVENVRALDMVVSYHNAGINIEDVERKTQIIMLPHRKVNYFHKMGFFSDTAEEWTGSEMEQSVQDAIEKGTGITAPRTYTSKLPSRVLEQHRWLDLDDDGIEEPYIVWVDQQTGNVLRLSIRYKTDAQGNPSDYKEPIEFFTHYVYLENPDGFYGLGLGHMVGDMNKAANRMLRQTIDAATLQNAPPMLATKNAGIRKGTNTIMPGKIATIDGMVDDIRKGIQVVPMSGPSAGLVRSMDALTQRADRLGMVTDALTGQMQNVVQPTMGQQLIEQGLAGFTAVQVRVHGSFEQELQKLYRLNSMYLDEQQYFAIQDVQKADPQVQQVFKQDFADDLQVIPTFDPMQATEQMKQKRAAMEYEAAVKNPMIVHSPKHLAAATRRFFEGIGTRDIDEFVPSEQEIQQQVQQQQQKQEQMQQMQQQVAQMKAQLAQGELQVKQQGVQVQAAAVQGKTQKDQVNAQIKAWTNQHKIELQRLEIALQAMAAKESVKSSDFDGLISMLQHMQGMEQQHVDNHLAMRQQAHDEHQAAIEHDLAQQQMQQDQQQAEADQAAQEAQQPEQGAPSE